ncbi:MAG: SpoIIE family protein phosphatase [Leptospiraceae bacterium]|nr:SpoIIE family protein phosphatase [Leptospiraceae bacterium]
MSTQIFLKMIIKINAMKNWILIQKLILTFFLICTFPLYSVESYSIELLSSQQNITPFFEYYQEENKILSLDEVRNSSHLFRVINKETYNSMTSTNHHWFHIRIFGKIDEAMYLELDDSILERVDVFLLRKERLKLIDMGKGQEWKPGQVRNRNFIIELPFIEDHEELEIYIKIYSRAPIFNSFNIYNTKRFHDKKFIENFLLGIYYGLLILFGIYNVFIFFFSKEMNFLYNFFLISTLAFYELFTHNLIILFFDFTLGMYQVLYLIVINLLQLCVLYIFSELQSYKVEYYTIKKIRNFILIFLIFIMSFGYHSQNILDFYYLLFIDGVIFSTLCLFFLYMIVKKDNQLYMYAITWSPLILGSVLFLFRNYFHDSHIGYVKWGFEASVVIQAISITLIFSSKIGLTSKILREEKNELKKVSEEENIKLKKIIKDFADKQKKIQDELQLASDVQRGLIPSEKNEYEFISVKYHCEYLMDIGGDFFDIISIDKDTIAVYIGDVSGHGVSAALLTTLFKMSFQNFIKSDSKPNEIFQNVNEQTKKTIHTNDYMTAFLLIIHSDGTLLYSSAAHKPAFLFRKKFGIYESLLSKGMFLGMSSIQYPKFEYRVDKLNPGDRILLYTDGVFLDNTNPGWNMDAFFQVFTNNQIYQVDTSLDKIVKVWKESKENSNLNDDATFLLLEFKGREK